MEKLTTSALNRLTPDAFSQSPKIPLVIVLDNIRSMHNVGAIFRIADAFLVEKIYLCGITATPPRAAIHKTALGAEETMAWQYITDTLTIIQTLQAQHYTILAVEHTSESSRLDQLMLVSEKKYALIFGHEVTGIQDQLLPLCDDFVEVPQYGTKHSLNVSVCAGIVIWEFSKFFQKNVL